MSHRNLRLKTLAVGFAPFLAVLLMASTPASAVTSTATDRGWFDEIGQHRVSNKNAYAGQDGSAQFRSFFVFDLSSLSGTATSATLRLEHEQYFGPDATETFDVFDVSTSAAALGTDHFMSNAAGQSIYDDLGTGNLYASNIVASPGTVGTILEITLNSQAITDINNALGGTFSVGLKLRDPFTLTSGSEAVRFSVEDEPRTHELVLGFESAVPEPITATLGLMGLGVLGMATRRRTA
jgi:hypothetical protein